MTHFLSTSKVIRESLGLPPFFNEEFNQFQFVVGWELRNKIQPRTVGAPGMKMHPDAATDWGKLNSRTLTVIDVMTTVKLYWMTGFGRERLSRLRAAGKEALQNGFAEGQMPAPLAFIEEKLLLEAREFHHRGWLMGRQILHLAGISQPDRDTAGEEYLLTEEGRAANNGQVLSDAILLATMDDGNFADLLDACDRRAAELALV